MEEVVVTEVVAPVAQSLGARLLGVTSQFAKTNPVLSLGVIGAGTLLIAGAGVLAYRRNNPKASPLLNAMHKAWNNHQAELNQKLAAQAS